MAAESEGELAARLRHDPLAARCDTQVMPVADLAEFLEDTAAALDEPSPFNW